LRRWSAASSPSAGTTWKSRRNVKLARGDVDIDVWADDHNSPLNVIAIECKRWKTSVPKNVVHAFRAVVGDSGANTGLLIPAAGFQDGALEAAQYSNVRLQTWDEFQQMFAARWYGTFMAPRLFAEAGPLIDYTEPINSRITRKAAALDQGRLAEFRELRGKHALLDIGLMPLFMEMPGKPDGPAAPLLPLQEASPPRRPRASATTSSMRSRSVRCSMPCCGRTTPRSRSSTRSSAVAPRIRGLTRSVTGCRWAGRHRVTAREAERQGEPPLDSSTRSLLMERGR
jgi:hypothetical protein